ncbi:hypothetical protein TD95_003194 [Thielaviopsis punctulata]|uniref:RING-type E3 ubiquitin transferase n=1 Tax=Thielaviopsis punctulata TaxID=72032 RepID=A0A0F4ZCU3_9PEZI|nr:hypothetical protein TD95_003194 [Thielaviopsis punctulata]
MTTPAPAPVSATRSQSTWSFGAFVRHFSLFPPLAVVSLMDDNSTAFPARPAAFGPVLQDAGMNGQLWVGSSFSDDNLPDGDGDGELGCSDIPNWSLKISAAAAAAAGAGAPEARVPAASRPKGPRALKSSDSTPESLVWPSWPLSRPPVDDGTDDYLHQDAVAASRHAFGTAFAAASNDPTGPGGFHHADIQSMQETAEIAGKIVLLSRGGCGFLEKVKWAQRRGAIALIIGDNRKGGPLIQMYARGDTSNVTIPSIFVARTTGQLLAALSQPGSFLADAVDVHGKSAIKVQRTDKAYGKGRVKKIKPVDTHFVTGLSDIKVKGPEHNKLKGSENKSKVAPQTKAAAHPFEADETPGWFTRVFHWHTSEAASALHPVDPPARMASSSHKIPTAEIDKFIIGVQDWRDPDLVPTKKPTPKTQTPKKTPVHETEAAPEVPVREGLWITIAPSNETSSTLDLLLVVFISPVFTLAIVYMFVSVRDRIRDRRWRVPKSVVQRLPVRTYRRVEYSPSPVASPTPSSPRMASSPDVSTPTTPLLAPAGATEAVAEQPAVGSASGGYFGVHEALNSLAQVKMGHEARKKKDRAKKESQWQKYMGRQSECVVCLEEYEDGVSQVMSLPCGHEFHEQCITTWLTGRRRTCPICKGDVLQSLEEGASAGSYESSYTSVSTTLDEQEPASPPPQRGREPAASDELEASTFRLARSIASSLRSGIRGRVDDVEAQNGNGESSRSGNRAEGGM